MQSRGEGGAPIVQLQGRRLCIGGLEWGGWSGLRSQLPSHSLHDGEVVGEVVDGVEGGGEGFAGLHEVAQVGARVATADHTLAGGIGRALILGILFALDVEAAFAGEEQAVARGAGGQDAIHHVDTHASVLLDFVGVSHTHDVAGLVRREQGQDLGDHLEGEVARLANAQAADGEAIKAGAFMVQFDEALGALAAEVAIHAALDDAEEGWRGNFA